MHKLNRSPSLLLPNYKIYEMTVNLLIILNLNVEIGLRSLALRQPFRLSVGSNVAENGLRPLRS